MRSSIAVLLGLVAFARSAGAEPCEPARAVGDLDGLPAAWGDALSDLVDATRDPSQPWGCPRALVALAVAGEGATLVVERPGARSMERPVTAPADLVPIGKAMLARAEAAPPPELPAPPPPASAGPDAATSDAPAAAYLDATAAFRYHGTSNVMTAGASLRGTLPVGQLRIGLAGRYTQLVAPLSNQQPELGFTDLGITAILGYQLVDAPVRFVAGLTGSVVVVGLETEGPDPIGDLDDRERDQVDARLGLEARLAVPLGSVFSFLSALEVEMAPAALAQLDRRLDAALPFLPSYVLGLSAGLEVSVP
ncbi:MAG: hypothetical protein R3B72_31240 [Polyangiaceae bacterium]